MRVLVGGVMTVKKAIKKHGFRYCLTCKSKLQKWGVTAAGTQRWKYLVCTKSATKPRADLRQAKVSRDHSKWLLGKQSQKDVAAQPQRTARQFRRKIAWCWDAPSLAGFVLTGEIHQAVIIDGIRIGSSVCLIARTTQFVIGWACGYHMKVTNTGQSCCHSSHHQLTWSVTARRVIFIYPVLPRFKILIQRSPRDMQRITNISYGVLSAVIERIQEGYFFWVGDSFRSPPKPPPCSGCLKPCLCPFPYDFSFKLS